MQPFPDSLHRATPPRYSDGRYATTEVSVSDSERKLGGVSSEAVSAATGRSWEDWITFLDGLGASAMTHKDIVALVAGPGRLSSGWWQQSVAVGYEQARGLRVVGQTSTADFQIGVQKTIHVPLDTAWALLTQSPGRDVWLGQSGDIEFRKGEKYTTAEGSTGEIRSCVTGERVRLTWSHPGLARQSTLQIYLAPSGDRTSIRLHQERLSSLEERELMRDHWRNVLAELANLA